MKNKFLTLKLILITSLFSTLVFADARPKIALVLSGGGARGGAHVGVLKVLEEKRIPIDFIVGTSMGSFVGGLYASGRSAHDIEVLLTTTDWKKYIRTDFVRADIPMRKKETEYQYQGRLGIGIDVENDLVLPTGVFKRQPMLLKFEEEFEHVQDIHDFSKLAIPFKAVATNIKNGEAVVLESGSLARSVYASSAIPGGFQPININGLDLVDGGVSDNMPIGLAKKMGADIIIAVDVSENFEKNLDINSYFVVMGQLINILMRKNANESIATLEKQDILITPGLKGITGLDAHKYKEIIQAGVEATNKLYDTQLKHLSISSSEYAIYQNSCNLKTHDNNQIIDAIVINNPSYISDDVIRKRLSAKVGEKLNLELLRKDILHIYNMGLFDSITHSFTNKNGQNTLEITSVPSWDNHGEIRMSFGLEDDFDGHSTYSLKFGYTMFGLNEYGGEWKSDFEIGRSKLASTEIYQPLGSMQRFYIKPSLSYINVNELIPARTLGFDQEGSLEMGVERYGATLGLGAYLNRDYKFEIGISTFTDSVEMELLEISEKYNTIPIHASIKTDNLDNLNFPSNGFKGNVIWTKEMSKFGSDYDYEQIYLDMEKPINIGPHNITSYLKYGSTYEQNSVSSLAGGFSLGGLFNLSGFVPYSLNNENMFLGVVKYRYELKNGGFFGSLNAPLYVGFSAEIGNTWGRDDNVNYDMLHKSGTVYFSADTILGPFYFAYGFSDGKERTTYLYLGEKF